VTLGPNGKSVAVLADGVRLALPAGSPAGPCTLAIRPERILVAPPASAANRLPVRREAWSYHGARNLLVARLGPHLLRIDTAVPPPAEEFEIALPREAIIVFARASGGQG
jgi:hypothetical protein